MNNAKLLSMFGSVAEVVIAARLYFLQRFKVCDLTLARSNGSTYVLAIIQRVWW